MFIRLFRTNNPSAFIFLPLIAVAIWLAGFTEPQIVAVRHAMPLYEGLVNLLSGTPWLAMTLSLLLVVGEAFLLNYIVNENEILLKQSYLPAFFYIVLMSNNNAMLSFHPLLPANFFMLLGLHRVLVSYRKDHAFSNAFDTGLLFSLASLFYFPYVVFFPLLGAAFIILRPFSWREWMISFFGVLIPYIFATVFYFWRSELDYLWYDKMLFSFIRPQSHAQLQPSFYLLLFLGLTILILSLAKLLTTIGGGPQKTKKGIVLLFWFFLFSGLSILIAPEISTRYFSALAIPVSVFFAFYFLNMQKEWLGELLCLSFIVTMVVDLLIHYF